MAIEIRVFNNNVEKAIRVLKKKMLKEGCHQRIETKTLL